MGVGHPLGPRPAQRLVVAVMLLALGLLAGLALALLVSGEWMARLLTPPPYPGSVRFNYERTESTHFVMESAEYFTPDAPAQVAARLGRLYGGFVLLGSVYERAAVGYNVSNALALAGGGNRIRPTSTVWVYPDATTGATTIKVQLMWPRP